VESIDDPSGAPIRSSKDFINTTGPTGEYYEYGKFPSGSGNVFKGGGDVDSYGDLIYVNRDGTNLDVYRVTIADSDGDGVVEPDQHPDNDGPDGINGTADDQIGPMEVRTLTYVTTYSVPALKTPTVGEIYAAADRVYFISGDTLSGANISEYIFATGVTNTIITASPPTGQPRLSQLGYDDVNDKWYASSEAGRRVYSWNGSQWVLEFNFVQLGGGHMDGLEVITDPVTNTPYVYVSDMTSDYIGQWHYDGTNWVEDNLFEYNGTAGDVEGMGFGALGHIWVTTGFTSSGTLYELGGGQLGQFIPKSPTTLRAIQYRWSPLGPQPPFSFGPPNNFRARLQVLFLNQGPADAKNVIATIMNPPIPPNVTVHDGVVFLGDIDDGDSKWSSDDFDLTTDLNNMQPPCDGIMWKVEYDDTNGYHHVEELIPEFAPGYGPCP
jgi:hypothetical protein